MLLVDVVEHITYLVIWKTIQIMICTMIMIWFIISSILQNTIDYGLTVKRSDNASEKGRHNAHGSVDSFVAS